MTEPQTEAGRRLLLARDWVNETRPKRTAGPKDADFDFDAFFMAATELASAADPLAIEQEATDAEADHWRRMPGSYRTEDGGREVIVGIDESTSFVVDEFPDEAAALQRAARADLAAAIVAAVGELPWDGSSWPDRAAVLDAIRGASDDRRA